MEEGEPGGASRVAVATDTAGVPRAPGWLAAGGHRAQAISGAQALIEATTKLVLKQLGVAYDEHADIPALVKGAQKALGLHPETLAPTGRAARRFVGSCPT